MDRIRLIIMVGLVAAGLGCRSESSRVPLDNPNSTGWGLENIQKASTHSNVLLVCVYEDHLEKNPPGYYHIHHFKGTVVRTYKGSWEVSERVNFGFQLEALPPNIVSNACTGSLIHLFTDFHESEEFCCQPGESRWYDPNDARDLEYLFPNGKSR